MNSTTSPATPGADARLIHRQVTFTLDAFDRLKSWQRHLERTERRSFTNGEILDRIIPAAPAP